MNSASPPRRVDIDVAKGLGMLLVVYGHLLQTGTVGETTWYAFSRDAIYTFHMPFFMYLSGYVFFMTRRHVLTGTAYRRMITARADRLLVPFFVFGLLIVFGKVVAQGLGVVHDPVASPLRGVVDVVLNTPDNPAISVWYLLVLFVYCVATPPLLRLAGGRILVLTGAALLVSVVAELLWLPQEFYLLRILRFYVFFVAGGAAFRYWDAVVASTRRFWIPLAVLFAIAIAIGPNVPLALLYCGFLSLPVLHGTILFLRLERSTLLRWVGDNSMAIYLMNTIFIGVAKLVWLKVLPVQGGWNPAFLLALMVAGVAGPVVVRIVVQRIAGIRFFSRYLT